MRAASTRSLVRSSPAENHDELDRLESSHARVRNRQDRHFWAGNLKESRALSRDTSALYGTLQYTVSTNWLSTALATA